MKYSSQVDPSLRWLRITIICCVDCEPESEKGGGGDWECGGGGRESPSLFQRTLFSNTARNPNTSSVAPHIAEECQCFSFSLKPLLGNDVIWCFRLTPIWPYPLQLSRYIFCYGCGLPCIFLSALECNSFATQDINHPLPFHFPLWTTFHVSKLIFLSGCHCNLLCHIRQKKCTECLSMSPASMAHFAPISPVISFGSLAKFLSIPTYGNPD